MINIYYSKKKVQYDKVSHICHIAEKAPPHRAFHYIAACTKLA